MPINERSGYKMPIEGRTEEDFTNILAKAMWPLLNHNQGIVVHYQDEGYYVAKLFDEESQWQIKIVRDDSVLKYKDRDFLNLTVEPKKDENGN